MLKKALLILAVVAVGLVLVIATRPDSFQVERSVRVAAPPPVPFALVNDFHGWNDWSPWEKLDPGMKKTFTGAPAGQGAVYTWSGNDKVGEGRMTILDSRPGERVDIKLEFIRPFAATNQTTLAFAPSGPNGEGSQVTWTMSGKNNFMSKAFSLFMNMDEMIGKDFERGLAALKDLSEAEARRQADAARAAAAAAAAAPAPVAPVAPAPVTPASAP